MFSIADVAFFYLSRNLSVLVESAVRNHLLRLKGYDATEVLIERQQQSILEQQ